MPAKGISLPLCPAEEGGFLAGGGGVGVGRGGAGEGVIVPEKFLC